VFDVFASIILSLLKGRLAEFAADASL
jgi:hypothetical protein